MKPLSVEMACLLGIQNEIQSVWPDIIIKMLQTKFLQNITYSEKATKIRKNIQIVLDFSKYLAFIPPDKDRFRG
jgi:hypothetical protein